MIWPCLSCGSNTPHRYNHTGCTITCLECMQTSALGGFCVDRGPMYDSGFFDDEEPHSMYTDFNPPPPYKRSARVEPKTMGRPDHRDLIDWE